MSNLMHSATICDLEMQSLGRPRTPADLRFLCSNSPRIHLQGTSHVLQLSESGAEEVRGFAIILHTLLSWHRESLSAVPVGPVASSGRGIRPTPPSPIPSVRGRAGGTGGGNNNYQYQQFPCGQSWNGRGESCTSQTLPLFPGPLLPKGRLRSSLTFGLACQGRAGWIGAAPTSPSNSRGSGPSRCALFVSSSRHAKSFRKVPPFFAHWGRDQWVDPHGTGWSYSFI